MTRKSPRNHSDPAAQKEEQPVPASSRVQNICLSQLVLSPTNVRATPATPAEDAALEASIRANGILQNLIVHPTGIDGRGAYEVDAGGRRLKIMQKLAAEGAINADSYKVPCKIEKAESAVESSLAENTIRVAMHPADEFVSIAALIDSGVTIDDIARRFGVSERHVRQRLRLGKLAPELLDAYRAGAINLEAVTAFTLGADHAAQLAVWNQLKDHSYVSPHTIRRLLTESAIPLDSDLGMFVGAETYEAAGGPITRDLFSGDDDGFMDDAALVRRLALEKLEAKAAELRPQWQWTRAALDLEYGELAQYARLRPQPAEIPADLAAEIERIEQRLGEIEDIEGDDWTDELAAEAAELGDRSTEIDETIDGLAVYNDQQRAGAGVIVTIGNDGEFCLHQGLVERGSHASSDRGNANGHAGEDEDGDPADRDGEPASRPHVSLTPEQTVRKQCGFSQLLVDDLKAHRHQITRAHLAENFEVAFDLALYALCTDLFRHIGYQANPLDLRAAEAAPRSSLNDLSGTPADRWLDTQKHVLELDWLKSEPEQGFAALAALPPEEKQRLFAWCIASTLKPQLAIEDHADPALEAAGNRLNIGFEDYWRPTAANYWGRVKKAHGLETGREILGERWARDHAGDKKPVIAASLETAFDPQKSGACINLGQAERDNAAKWLPPGMSYGAPAAIEIGADTGNSEHEPAEFETEAGELPAFLTEDEAEDSAAAVL
jgi:ParB family transcriptional regulator, chromosome partitioning protein